MTTTETDTTNPIATLVDTYFEMWRTTDPTERASLVGRAFTEDGRHVDQHADATGHTELAEMIGSVHAGYPGFEMLRTSGVDHFGDQVRFGWELHGADGALIVAGLDIGEVADDGRLRRVTGFWGDLPAV